ncbi:MAG TPA: M81 family metallopeptidase [Stellaceae bacterium]|jgi:microcystin degradation protein MlrC|nr:M81 family metallopeptidase [Stellaceae bacterium]
MSNPPRIALMGFSIECNKFAPVATKAHFLARTYLEGDDIVGEARGATPTMLPETPGFIAAMDAAGPWIPVGIALAMTEPNGPVDHPFFTELLETIRTRLTAALPVDGVYICAHGAAVTTEDDDPEGTMFAMVRGIVGDDVPIVATFDLHANVSDRMVQSIDAFIGYRTNPHLDMRERGEEAAAAMREMLAGVKTERALIRLPIVAPTVTLLTAAGPYADMIEFGQSRMAPEIMNVSVMGGFAYADTAKNGMAIIVTARRDDRRNQSAAMAVAREIAEFGWSQRERFYPRLTSLDDAVARAVTVSTDLAAAPLIFADVADNPGGGARGNTMFLLKALVEAGVRGALVGVIYDPPLAAEAHKYGLHYRFDAEFNRAEDSEFSESWTARARVAALTDGNCVGRRGIYNGLSLHLGPCAALAIGGVTVVVISHRVQCADPIFFEMMGLDIARARVVVVKSRGHFRGGYDEFFAPEQIVEVDLPGLTSPVLSRFDWKRLPRPVIPLDNGVEWSPLYG